jgi:protein-tyrosine phosphatase
VPTWLEPWPILAGPHPTVKQARRLAEDGITLFLDLTEPGEEAPYAHAVERHVRVSIEDHTAPEDAAVIAAALDAIDAELDADGMVYVHCWWGCGRTGLVLGCWLRRRGHGPDEALARVAALRGSGCPEMLAQVEAVRAWAPDR